jgi:hypothetical protein
MAYTNIDDPSAYFQTALYAGNGSTQSITNDGNSNLQPDWIWTKSRSDTSFHLVTDSTRGTTKRIYPNSTAAEETHSNMVTAFNSDGFSIGNHSAINTNGYNYAAWQWKANGGTTSSLSNTGPDSVVQVNSDAKFVIGTYTGNGSNSNVKHGLGETPDMLIVKRRTGGTGAWAVWHKDLTTGYWLRLDDLMAQASGVWDGLNPQSEKFFITGGSSNVNISGSDYVFYAWKSVQGYSKFGSYVGNGSVDGPFVYTGFKPALVICKRIDSTNDWGIVGSKRETYNGATKTLFADLTNAESSTYTVDLLSNGFKPSSNHSIFNQSGGSYIYMAFAENPFTTSTGIPTTAR